MAAVTQVRILVTAFKSKFFVAYFPGYTLTMSDAKFASAGNRTRINCLEGSYADHYTTDASMLLCNITEVPYVQNISITGEHLFQVTKTWTLLVGEKQMGSTGI